MKYPKGIVKKNVDKQKLILFKNKGMGLEDELNKSNIYYLENNIANIHKKPTLIQVVKSKNNIIEKAFFKEASTTDYNGVYKGRYIDYEAKETSLKTFPLKNIRNHQINHLRNILQHKGISFIIVKFTYYDEYFLLKTENLLDYLKNIKKQSIPYEYFKKNAYEIKRKFFILDYLKEVDKILEEINE